jgi:hypothetical protein
MPPSRTLSPLLWSLILLTLACASLSPPAGPEPQTPTNPAKPSPTVTPPPTPTPLPQHTAAPLPQTSTPTATLFPEEQLRTVTDQTGAIEATLPIVWTDLRSAPWLDPKGQTLGTRFLASTDIEAFLKFQAEGVEISVSRHLPVGYTQLLETEYDFYVGQCQDTYRTRWRLDDHPVYRGLYVVFGECAGQPDAWLSLFSLVNRTGPDRYIARVVAYDRVPTYGDDFREMILKFRVFPANLP